MLDFRKMEDAQTLAQAIVNTIPEPFVVLDDEFRVLAASVSFYKTFKVDPEHTRGRLLYSLGDGQWDIPALRVLLETIIPEHAAMDGFEVEHDFPNLGRRTMLLNARQVIYENNLNSTILLAFPPLLRPSERLLMGARPWRPSASRKDGRGRVPSVRFYPLGTHRYPAAVSGRGGAGALPDRRRYVTRSPSGSQETDCRDWVVR